MLKVKRNIKEIEILLSNKLSNNLLKIMNLKSKCVIMINAYSCGNYGAPIV